MLSSVIFSPIDSNEAIASPGCRISTRAPDTMHGILRFRHLGFPLHPPFAVKLMCSLGLCPPHKHFQKLDRVAILMMLPNPAAWLVGIRQQIRRSAQKANNINKRPLHCGSIVSPVFHPRNIDKKYRRADNPHRQLRMENIRCPAVPPIDRNTPFLLRGSKRRSRLSPLKVASSIRKDQA